MADGVISPTLLNAYREHLESEPGRAALEDFARLMAQWALESIPSHLMPVFNTPEGRAEFMKRWPMRAEGDLKSILVDPADATRLADYCAVRLDLAQAKYPDEYRYADLSFCVLDAVFSIGVTYESTQSVVSRYATHCGRPTPWRPASEFLPPVQQRPLSSLVKDIEDRGAIVFANEVLKNRQRTSTKNGILKAEAVLEFARLLSSQGIEFFQDLPKPDARPELDTALKGIRGLGSGIAVDYFWMLSGDESLMKLDRMVERFLREAGEPKRSAQQTLELLRATAQVLCTRHPHVTPRLLDYMIWDYQRRVSATAEIQTVFGANLGPTVS
jgi:hypothetical protein